MNECGRGLQRRATRLGSAASPAPAFSPPRFLRGAGCPGSPLFPPTALSLGLGARDGGAQQDTPSAQG